MFVPSDAAARLTTNGPVGSKSFALTMGSGCTGLQLDVDNHCEGCGSIGEIPNLPDCSGHDGGANNDLYLCFEAPSSLVPCGDTKGIYSGMESVFATSFPCGKDATPKIAKC